MVLDTGGEFQKGEWKFIFWDPDSLDWWNWLQIIMEATVAPIVFMTGFIVYRRI